MGHEISHWVSPQGVCDIELLPSLFKNMARWSSKFDPATVGEPCCPLSKPPHTPPRPAQPNPARLPLQHHWPVTTEAKNIPRTESLSWSMPLGPH